MAGRFAFFAASVLSILHFTVATPDSLPRNIFRRDICTENGQVDCFDSCMPPDGVCCNDGSGTYCPFGNNCVPNGCCPIGEECSGGGGTITNDFLTGTGSLPTDTSIPESPNTPTTAIITPTNAEGSSNVPIPTAEITYTPIQTVEGSSTPATVTVTNTQTTASANTVKNGGNAMSALINNSERYALLLITAGQLLLGW